MVHKVTLIPGDGIGPEVVNATVRVLEATGLKFEWEPQLAGAEAYAKTKQYIPKELYESVERTRLALKGPVTTPIAGGFASINVTLRKKFELFANFRPTPSRCDVLVRKTLSGDSISDLLPGLGGGMGLAPGPIWGHECPMSEGVQGSAPKIEGKVLLTPPAVMQSAVLMLRHVGESE